MIEGIVHAFRGLLDGEQSRQGLAAIVVSLGIAYWTYFVLLPALTLRKIPFAGQDPGLLPTLFGFGMAESKLHFKKNALKVLDEGYFKHKNGLFQVQTLNESRVVLSPAYFEEITKRVPEDVLNVNEGLSERLMGKYTNLDIVFNSDMHIDVCRTPLTQNLPKIISGLNDEAEYWLQKRISGRTELNAHDLIVRVIAATSTRMLGGAEPARNAEWLESAAGYAYDVVAVAQHLRQFSPLLRPFILPFLDSKKALDKHLAVANKTFRDVFVQRFKLLEGGSFGADKPADMVQWMIEAAEGNDKDLDVLAQNMLFMTLAGVHTSSNTTMHAIFDLCTYPQYTEGIRAEVKKVVAEDGWTMAALSKMKKLDSFIKESQRLNQTVLMTFNRRLAKSLKFEDGTLLPQGTYITMPSVAVSRDPAYFANPNVFDGTRFSEAQTESKLQASRQSFAAIGPENLAFGFGKTACPGRFFAGAQIKAVLANIILNYEISFPNGQTTRPDNLVKGGLIAPNPKQKIVFKQIS